MTEEKVTCKTIEPTVIFGFDGSVVGGLKLHPDKEHIIFPLGSKVGISPLKSTKQEFLTGHTDTVSCLDISPSGKYVCSGQNNKPGLRACVILWDWANRKEIGRYELHKVSVQSVCFTVEESYIVSVGGPDDLSIIVYDIAGAAPICGSPATNTKSGQPYLVARFNVTTAAFLTAGERHLRVWHIDNETKKLKVQDGAMGKLQRCYTSLRVTSNDDFLYSGTMSGDVVKCRLNVSDYHACKEERELLLLGCYGRHNPSKPPGKDCEQYINGVRDVHLLSKSQLIIATGSGVLELVEERCTNLKNYESPTWPQFKKIKETKVNGSITSLVRVNNDTFLIGTDNNEIYSLSLSSFDVKLLKTCHKDKVYDIVFPKGFSLVFATASYESIRIWSTARMKELLRIMVYNFTAASIVFSHDGTSIVSAWNDGVLRAFTPITGRLIYAIPNAHNKGCSAVTISSSNKVLVSGGIEGQVRVWKIEPHRQSLVAVLKEHSAPIVTVDFNRCDSEVVSASSDGTCIIWDMKRLVRKHILYANTQFMCARYFPTGVQILAAGTDKRISYWEVFDGSLVREVEGSKKGTINSISINATGEYFLSVSDDQTVKLWDYQQGVPLFCGYQHAAPIISCRFSPCGKFFVTGSADGAILIWDVPEEYWPKQVKTAPKKIEAGPQKTDSKSKLTKSKECIEQVRLRSKDKDVVCIECPSVDKKMLPEINEVCQSLKT